MQNLLNTYIYEGGPAKVHDYWPFDHTSNSGSYLQNLAVVDDSFMGRYCFNLQGSGVNSKNCQKYEALQKKKAAAKKKRKERAMKKKKARHEGEDGYDSDGNWYEFSKYLVNLDEEDEKKDRDIIILQLIQ